MSGPGPGPDPVKVELSAVVFALGGEPARQVPLVLTPDAGQGPDLPTAAYDPGRHPRLQTALRDWVAERTGLELGHVEQLYTFGDPIRSRAGQPHTVSIGYLALVGPEAAAGPAWSPWARWFPWEDRRHGPAPLIGGAILPALAAWAGAEAQRVERVRLLFGTEDHPWRDELALERYELLYEADLVPEAFRDRGEAPPALPPLGSPAPRDHRRIMATGIGRLRGKLKYRPVLFELVGACFTLLELQRAAEAVSGVALHKQNFRRMVERSGLIEPTGSTTARHGGRPAAEYRLAPEATWERRAASVRFGGARRGPPRPD
ncbi:NAD regulator [Paralimibaculum aggregatum]|uniref:NAD regulator n=1 Tax=Paralimibaculum aggregatum TaxID=3036245 RepID=A0ABQ6LT87_9RHOB|nr:NAD regulator [Limibaculum sp. NKW23]GMG85273.1 NAD regulator [Limibaculum sp. NKW23]